MTDLPFLGEGQKNYELWLELQKFIKPESLTSIPKADKASDNQIIDYLNPNNNKPLWTFKYIKSSAFGDKWYFRGGAPQEVYEEGVSAIAANNTAFGPTLTVPVGGLYLIGFGIGAAIIGAGGGGRVQLTRNGAGTSGTNTQLEIPASLTTSPGMFRELALAAGDVLGFVANNGGWANGSLFDKWITATPIRVSG